MPLQLRKVGGITSSSSSNFPPPISGIILFQKQYDFDHSTFLNASTVSNEQNGNKNETCLTQKRNKQTGISTDNIAKRNSVNKKNKNMVPEHLFYIQVKILQSF